MKYLFYQNVKKHLNSGKSSAFCFLEGKIKGLPKKKKVRKKKRKHIFYFCPQNSMLGSSLCKNYQAKTSGKESYETAGNVAGLLFIFCL